MKDSKSGCYDHPTDERGMAERVGFLFAKPTGPSVPMERAFKKLPCYDCDGSGVITHRLNTIYVLDESCPDCEGRGWHKTQVGMRPVKS